MTLAIYLYVLAGGFLFALLSVALGHLEGGSAEQVGHGAGQASGHLMAGHGSSVATHGHTGTVSHSVGHAPISTLTNVALRTTAWFVSPLAVAAFALLFGGTGACLALLLPGSAHLITFVAACLMGIVGFAGIKSLMALFARSSSAPLSLDATGSEGTLVFGIKLNEKGEQLAGQVQYEVEGLWRTTLAHTRTNIALQRGTRVRIVGRDSTRGVVIVEAIDPLDELPAARQAIPASRA